MPWELRRKRRGLRRLTALGWLILAGVALVVAIVMVVSVVWDWYGG